MPDALTTIESSWLALLRQLPTSGLTALRDALAADSAELVQGATVKPCPREHGDAAPTAACALGYGMWKQFDIRTARQVDREFGSLCLLARGDNDEMTAALNWFDEAPRAEAFALIGRLCGVVLAEREKESVACA